MKKYELTEETIQYAGRTLHRIRAVRDFADVKAGNLGGWIENECNLDQDGECWVCGNAKVWGDAEVYGNAKVYDNAVVFGDAVVYGNAEVFGDAEVYGNAAIKFMDDYIVFKNWWSSGRWFTWTRSDNMWKVGCFHGTGEELVEKAYKDSEESGRHYKEIVDYVERCVLGKEVENE